MQQTCAETNEILFINNQEFLVLNGQNFQYERRNAIDLSMVSNWSETNLKFFGKASMPDSNYEEIYFLSGDSNGNKFIVQYDLSLNNLLIISDLAGQ